MFAARGRRHMNPRRIRFHGMKRSGNHAVITWIFGHTSGMLINNILPDQKVNLYRKRGNVRYGTGMETLIISHEDCDPSRIPEHDAEKIGLIRSFRNMWSSRLRAPRQNPIPVGEEIFMLWEEYALDCLAFPEKYIIFDRWFADSDYRRELETRYGWEMSDSHLNIVPTIGKGSSFDGHQKKGQDMNVLRRYEEIGIDMKFPKKIMELEEAVLKCK
jgi:hypothetical protein